MIPYFSTVESRQKFRAVALSWLKTPFVPHGRSKGHGADCISLAALIYLECGCIDSFNPPDYTMDGGSHLAASLLESEVLSAHPCEKIWSRSEADGKEPVNVLPLLVVGDLLFFKLGRVPHHCGVYIGNGQLVHTMAPVGAIIGEIVDPSLSKRIHTVYRP